MFVFYKCRKDIFKINKQDDKSLAYRDMHIGTGKRVMC